MAVNSATTLTVTRSNIREEVANIIYNISPMKTPLMSMMRRERTRNIEFQIPQDELRDPVENAQLEGDEASFEPSAPVRIIKSHVQLFDDALLVSDTAVAVSNYGYRSELSYQLGKRGQEIKLDMERAIARNRGAVKRVVEASQAANRPAQNTQVAGKTAGMPAWIASNFKSLKAANQSTPGGYQPGTGKVDAYNRNTTGDDVGFTEQDIRDMLVNLIEDMDDLGTSVIMMGIRNRERASRKLAGIAAFRADGGRSRGARTAVASVDFYRSDFGLHRLMFNRWMDPSNMFFLDMKYWALRYLQQFDILPIARTGHGRKRLLKAELGTCCKHEKTQGILVDVSDGGA